MAGFTKKFVKRELIITLKSHNNNFPSVVFTLLRCVYGCLWPACACVRVCAYIYTKPRQQKFRAMNGAHLATPIRGELGYAHWPQLGTQFIALLGTKFGAHYGNKMFAITAAKFVFSNSGNFRAKANPPKPRPCPKRPFGQ